MIETRTFDEIFDQRREELRSVVYVSALAWCLWDDAGRPNGQDRLHWLEAEEIADAQAFGWALRYWEQRPLRQPTPEEREQFSKSISLALASDTEASREAAASLSGITRVQVLEEPFNRKILFTGPAYPETPGADEPAAPPTTNVREWYEKFGSVVQLRENAESAAAEHASIMARYQTMIDDGHVLGMLQEFCHEGLIVELRSSPNGLQHALEVGVCSDGEMVYDPDGSLYEAYLCWKDRGVLHPIGADWPDSFLRAAKRVARRVLASARETGGEGC